MHAFLERYSKKAPGNGLKINFSKWRTSDRLTGLYHQNGLHGTFKASDRDAFGNISPFFEAFVDTLCGLWCKSEATRPLTEYVQMVNFVFRFHRNFE